MGIRGMPKTPRVAVGSVHVEPTKQVGNLSEGTLLPNLILGLPAPTESGFPVTWCWLTLTGTLTHNAGLELA